jgi:hypothetical protein
VRAAMTTARIDRAVGPVPEPPAKCLTRQQECLSWCYDRRSKERNPLFMISVVMPVYNSDRYLDEAIWSIRRQTLTGYEFVIINDGSSDRSGGILRQHAADDQRMRVLEQSNQGYIPSLNRGCTEARGDFIARMDADDISLPDRLAKQAAYLQAHPEVAVVGGSALVLGTSSPEPTYWRFPTSPAEIKRTLLSGNALAHPTVMMRRGVFLAVGGYRTGFLGAEDYDLWLRIAETHDLANLSDVLLHYRRHPGQVSVRHCCQQALSALAARYAAERRRDTGRDPIPDVPLLDHPSLLQMGVPPVEVERSLLGAPLTQAKELLRDGRRSEARQLLGEICRLLSAQPSSRSARSEIALWTGLTLLASHDHLRGAAWVARALALAPSRFATALKNRINRMVKAWPV